MIANWYDTYWAERIEVSLSREFVAQLRRNLPGWRICESTCAGLSPAASMRVSLDSVDYARAGKRLVASARIAVNPGATVQQGVERGFRYDFSSDLAGDDARVQAAAYAVLLERVAADAAALVPRPVLSTR